MNKTLAFVLKRSEDYDIDYVEKMLERLEKTDNDRFNIEILSDIEEIATIPLTDNLPGWWSKVELFKPDQFEGSVLYLDLDTIVLGDLEPYFQEEFTMLSDFRWPEMATSGVLSWSGDYSHIYDNWDESFIDTYTIPSHWGDGAYINYMLGNCGRRFQDLFPGKITSHKEHTEMERAMSDIVCYHGEPRPRDTMWTI